MDNSPRSVADEFYPPYSWVDYDANEALAARYLAKMADVTGDTAVAEEFRGLHAELKQLVNREMWSEADQFYWDLDKDGSFMKEKTVASFWPLWGQITEEKHVDGLVQHLNDEKEFNRPHRVPTLSADHPRYDPKGDYWRGSVWAPTNHMITKGLTANGRHELARTIVVNHLNNQAQVFQETETVWENYAPESPSPGEPASPDFVGWSADGPIAQLIEHYIGIRLDVPSDRINWMLLTDEKVGLRNLDFGGATVHLIAESRNSSKAPVELSVETPRALTVRLQDSRHEVDVEVSPSVTKYEIDLRRGRVQRG
jgi:Glycogen debranching enzyme